MTAIPGNALVQYRAVNAYGAASGDRLQLILRLMTGAIDRIVTASGHMRRRELAAKGEAIGRAIGIIDGLRTSLDKERGGNIATNLESLYDYMTRRLLEANLRNDERGLDEVAELLGEIRSAWATLVRTQSGAGQVSGS
jgi:flagellar protein FliS